MHYSDLVSQAIDKKKRKKFLISISGVVFPGVLCVF